MNQQKTFAFPTVDTVLNVLTVGGMAVACGALIVLQGMQSVVA